VAGECAGYLCRRLCVIGGGDCSLGGCGCRGLAAATVLDLSSYFAAILRRGAEVAEITPTAIVGGVFPTVMLGCVPGVGRAVRGMAEPRSQVVIRGRGGEFLCGSRALRRLQILVCATHRAAVGWGLGGGR